MEGSKRRKKKHTKNIQQKKIHIASTYMIYLLESLETKSRITFRCSTNLYDVMSVDSSKRVNRALVINVYHLALNPLILKCSNKSCIAAVVGHHDTQLFGKRSKDLIESDHPSSLLFLCLPSFLIEILWVVLCFACSISIIFMFLFFSPNLL